MSGCAICVYDLYEEALDEYKKAAESLRTSLRLLQVPEEQWPAGIQTKETLSGRKPPSTSMSAFEELEARLREKHAATAGSSSSNVAAGG